MPIEPAAPGFDSITTCWPQISASFAPYTRDMRSELPPGGYVTISFTGFVGNDCAPESPGRSASSSRIALIRFLLNFRCSAADFAAVAAGDREHRGARRHVALEVRPARRRVLEGRALVVARMLDREEERPAVGREARA